MLDEKKPAPRDRILQSAERLFAEKGLHGTGLREIARDAGVNVNLIAHHFGSKEGLYVAVTGGFSNAFSDRFDALLAEVERQYSPSPPPVSEIVRCFYEPAFQALARDKEGWHHLTLSYFREIGSTVWQGLNSGMARHVQRFATALHRAVPTASRDDLVVVLQLACLSPVLLASDVDRSLRGEKAGWAKDVDELQGQLIRIISEAALACASVI